MLRRRRPMMADINVTPFVDVMLVLLVIFMVTAPLMQHEVNVQLPEESITPAEVKEIPTVFLQSNKRIFWNDDKVGNLLELSKKAMDYIKTNKKGGVYLQADRTLDYGFVMRVMATMKRAGIQDIGMVTEPSES